MWPDYVILLPTAPTLCGNMESQFGIGHLRMVRCGERGKTIAGFFFWCCKLKFLAGSVPPEPIVKSYRNLLDSLLSTAAETDEPKRRDSGLSSNTSSTSKPVVALHCVSGIGRAPVLVAAALIDAGIDPLEAVELVRAKRRGALNKKQLAWLMDKKSGFKRRKRGKDGKGTISKMFGGMFGKK